MSFADIAPTTPAEELLELPGRLTDLASVRAYIERLDLAGVRFKLASREEGGLGWSDEKAHYVTRNYRRWLYLRRKYEHEAMPPTVQIDRVWHAHILDTRGYRRDCAKIFGYLLDHNPYFGVGGDDAQQRLDDAAERMFAYYEEEFKEPILDWDED